MNNLIKPLYSENYERSVLAALMLVENGFDKVCEIIVEADFASDRNRLVFRAVKALFEANEPVSTITVHDHLERTKTLMSAGGESYLAVILNSDSSLFNLVHYAKRIKELSVQRQLRSVLENGRLDINDDGNDLDFKIGNIVSELLSVTESENDDSNQIESISNLIEGFLQRQQDLMSGKRLKSQETGFFDLDLKSPIQNGNLVILAARPGMGKTTLALNALDNMVQRGIERDENGVVISKKIGAIFSTEMSKEEIVNRFISADNGIHINKVIKGEMDEDDWANAQKTIMRISDNYPLHIDDRTGITHQQIRASLMKLRSQGAKIGVVVIDYLQFMGGLDPNNMTNSIAVITKALKSIAKEFDCPIILLSQLSREVEKRPNKRPINSDLRSSGSIEQDADIILFIYRDEVYNENTEHRGIAEVIIGKNRHGEIGTVRLGFEGQHSRFSNFVNAYNQDSEYEYG